MTFHGFQLISLINNDVEHHFIILTGWGISSWGDLVISFVI